MLDGPGSRLWPRMEGRYVFKHAVTRFPEVIHEALEANGYTVPTSTSSSRTRRTSASARWSRWGSSCREEKVFNNIQRYGNTTAASIPIALHEARPGGPRARRVRSSASPPSARASRGRAALDAVVSGERAILRWSAREATVRPVLRDMRRDDLPAVLEIERRSFAQPWSRGFFEKELATPFARLVWRRRARESLAPPIVGYTCRWRVTDEVHLLNVAVHPEQPRPRHRAACWWRPSLAEARQRGARGRLARGAGRQRRRAPARTAGSASATSGVRRGYYGPGRTRS